MNSSKTIADGTIRIKAKSLTPFYCKNGSWKPSKEKLHEALHVAELFKAHKNLSLLFDAKNPQFLKGMLSPKGKPLGARINALPDGTKLDKAFSLFAPELTIHDETSNSHWDAMYKNQGGTYSYIYSLKKRKFFTKKKYQEVKEFEKVFPSLKRRVSMALKDENDFLALPMFTLLKTFMRVGNEIYFKAHHHKGLTTLKKKDILIKGNRVTFKFLSKGGVPRTIIESFPQNYVKRLRQSLKPLKPSSFVFVSPVTGHPLRDTQFEEAFENYCGKKFYPHIVRSYYATSKAKQFLASHRTATKKEVKVFFLSIAEKLGHKHFVKKTHSWEDSFTVTVHHYIQPKLVEKINSICEKGK